MKKRIFIPDIAYRPNRSKRERISNAWLLSCCCMVETIQWVDGAVVMIDQTRLPLEETYATCRTYQEVAAAILNMITRGAPAIRVAAALGVALGALHAPEENFDQQVETICETLASTRPTAVNLFWAIDQIGRASCRERG